MASSELLYQSDAYLQEFEAQVIAANAEAGALALNRTAFYPGGGGQPYDTGLLRTGDASLAVTKVQRVGELVWRCV